MKKRIIGRLVKDGSVKRGEVCFENGKMIYTGEPRANESISTVDFGNAYISAGFIDIHVHGGGGFDFSDGTKEAFIGASKLHAAHGTATMLPTTLSCPDDELFSLMDAFKSAKLENDGAYLYGLHLEGPYFAPSQNGAQELEFLKIPKKEHYLHILEKGKGIINRWTIAPELTGAFELGDTLKKEGILACMGHTDCDLYCAEQAFEHGYTHITHFYSCMSTIKRVHGIRIPGLLEYGYLNDNITVEIIADGMHIPKPLLQLVYKQKGASGTALVTDAMRGAGFQSGETMLGSYKNGQPCYIEDGVAKLPGGEAFAGSIATADRLVRNMITLAGAPLCEAVQMITQTPANICNIKNKGIIKEGYDADFTVFDDDIKILATVSNGKFIFGGECFDND